MGREKNILAGLIVAGSMCIANAQTAVNMSGTVTDASTGNPVAGAKVFLVGNPDITTTTGADGIFTLTGNATVGVKNGLRAGQSEMSIQGTQLSLKVAGDNTPVSVDVYTMDNRFVRNIVSRKATAGNYLVEASPAGLTNGMYVVRAQIGSQTAAFKMTSVGVHSADVGFRSVPVSARTGLAKGAVDPIDSLKVTKDGYKVTAKAITKYTGILTLSLNPKLPPGDLKIVSERAFPQVAWGKNVDVQVWDGSGLNGTQLDGGFKGSFFEGNQSWKITFVDAQPYSAWGFVTTVEPEDMSAWKGGTMHLAVRGTATSIGVTMGSVDQAGGFSKKVNLADYGYLPMTSVSDNKWYEIKIPMDDFTGTDFSAITVYCGLVYPVENDPAPFDATLFYQVDDIYWSLKK